jgi:hypothetical protein
VGKERSKGEGKEECKRKGKGGRRGEKERREKWKVR